MEVDIWNALPEVYLFLCAIFQKYHSEGTQGSQ